MKIFALNSARWFGELVAKELNVPLGLHEEREFEDGEHKCRPLESVRGEEIFLIQSLFSDKRQSVNDKFCRLLFFISTLKDASAKRVTAVLPYLCYSRKDRRTKPRDPVTTRYVARLIETAGADAIVTLDAHNLQAFQNAFTIPAENLEAKGVFVDYVSQAIGDDESLIMSPDFGGVKRAEQFQQALELRLGRNLDMVVMEKFRSGGEVRGERIAGDVKNKTVIIIDDLISTGTTLARAAAACKRAGSNAVFACASHGLFSEKSNIILKEKSLDLIVTTNTVLPLYLEPEIKNQKIVTLDVAPLFAATIRCLSEGGSISQLLGQTN